MRIAVALPLLGFAAIALACVGNDSTPETGSSTSSSSSGGASGNGSSGASTTSSSSSSGAASSSGSTSGNAGDSGPTASAACQDYCTAFDSSCAFSTTSTDSYPGLPACLAICSLMQEKGGDQDSVECRKRNLPASTPDQCGVAGPWGADFQDSKFCGDNVLCNSICRAISPKCTEAGTSLGDCVSLCSDKLVGPSSVRGCMEEKALLAYGAAATKNDIAKYCVDFKACN
jgi:hypothetical protein